MAGAITVRLATDLAIPGWASYVIGILLTLFVQAIVAAFGFSFASLGSRQGTTFLPCRDYSFYIGSIRTWEGAGNSRAPLPFPDQKSEVLVSR